MLAFLYGLIPDPLHGQEHSVHDGDAEASTRD
jgi:hypothetical protein